MVNKVKKDAPIDANNIEEVIMEAIKTYSKKGMLADMFFWRHAIFTLTEKYGINEKFNAALKAKSD